MQYLDHLSSEELQTLTDAIPYITVLIAGADGNIDQEEKEWANKLTHIRSYASEEMLREYYEKVGETFSDRLTHFINTLPQDVTARTAAISTELEKVNPILAGLENAYAHRMYTNFVSFAEHVAKSSGGFLRFGSVSKEEKAVMGLNMITPIEEEFEEES